MRGSESECHAVATFEANDDWRIGMESETCLINCFEINKE